MLAYFSRVTAAVCNYDARDAGAITRELEQLGATVLDRYTSACTHLLTPYRSGHEYEQALHEGKAVVSYGADSLSVCL
jgi:twin BRCT domain